MARDFSNNDDVIDSRDVTSKIADLESEKDDLQTARDEAQEILDGLDEDATDEEREEVTEALRTAEEALAEWQEDCDGGELYKTLTELAEECEGYASDWSYGETLIRDSYFENYARDLAVQCGDLKNCDSWPNRCIDWEQAADELKQDYTMVDFGGVDYWIRSC